MIFSRPSASATVKSLGAGDLIDRTIRLYRRNFGVFMLIAAPPVVVGTLLSLAWSAFTRTVIFPDGAVAASDTLTYYATLFVGTINVWLAEIIATLVVMGGASRNFVRNLLFDEELTFRQTYANSASRIWSLLVAAAIIAVGISIVGGIAFYLGLVAIFIAVAIVAFVLSSVPPLAVLVAVVVGLAVLYGVLWITLLVVSRIAFVPQAILVEGLGVAAAFARSATFSTWSVRRLMAMLVFTTLTALSALAILYVPVAWFVWANGLETSANDIIPMWLSVIYSLIGQLCFMLLSPVWMIGLSLLYIDTRIKSEAYDIELLATRRLGAIPDLPPGYLNPLQPALGHTVHNRTVAVEVQPQASTSILNLK